MLHIKSNKINKIYTIFACIYLLNTDSNNNYIVYNDHIFVHIRTARSYNKFYFLDKWNFFLIYKKWHNY